MTRITNEQEALRRRLIQQQHAEEHIRFVKDFARRAMYCAFGMVIGFMCLAIVYSMRNLYEHVQREPTIDLSCDTILCSVPPPGIGPKGPRGLKGPQGPRWLDIPAEFRPGPKGRCNNPPLQ